MYQVVCGWTHFLCPCRLLFAMYAVFKCPFSVLRPSTLRVLHVSCLLPSPLFPFVKFLDMLRECWFRVFVMKCVYLIESNLHCFWSVGVSVSVCPPLPPPLVHFSFFFRLLMNPPCLAERGRIQHSTKSSVHDRQRASILCSLSIRCNLHGTAARCASPSETKQNATPLS